MVREGWLSLLLVGIASAQVSVRFTPEGDMVPVAVLAHARQMDRYRVDVCLDGDQTVFIQPQRINMVAGDIRFIDPDDALTVLQGAQNRSLASTIVRVGQLAGQGAALGLALASKANLSWAAGIGIGASVAPQVVNIAQGQIPSIVPLVSAVKYPVRLDPGGCFTDHWFAVKMKSPKIVVATIPSSVKMVAVGAMPETNEVNNLATKEPVLGAIAKFEMSDSFAPLTW